MMMRCAMSSRARLPSMFNPFNRSFAQASRSPKAQGESQPQPQSQTATDGPIIAMPPSQQVPKKQDAMSKRESFPMAPPMRMNNLIGQLQNEIDSIMGAFESPFFSPFSSDLGRPLSMMDRRPASMMMMPGGGNMMAMDVTEDEKQFTIQAEVPGFTKEDIKVSLSPDQMLTVSGNMKAEDKDEEGGTVNRRTLRMSSFTRRLQLPTNADMESIKATTNHGVLTICVPKTGKPAPQLRDIPVE